MHRLLTLPTGRRAKWVVLACWLVVLFAAAPFGSQLFDAAEDTPTTYLPRDADSTRVIELQESFPGGESYALFVIYERPGGVTPGDHDRAATDLDALQQRYAPGADLAVVPSQDGQALLFQVPIATDGVPDTSERLVEVVGDARDLVGTGDGQLEVRVAGPAALTADSLEVFDTVELLLLLLPVAVVAVLLLLIYRSPMLFLVPLTAVVVANLFGSAVVYGLVEGPGLALSSLAAAVLGILIYGASTNYALLVIARYREELRRHHDRHDAMREALRRSGPAVLASGGTVLVGLLCLLVADVNSTRSLGPIGAIAIAGALLALLTLLPALLLVLGRWVFWPFIPRPGQPAREPGRGWRRLGEAIAARPRLTWLVTTIVIGAGALGILAFDTPQQTQFRSPPDSVTGQELLAAHYPAGSARPLDIIARAPYGAEVAAAARATDGVAAVREVDRTADLVALQATLVAEPDSRAEYQGIDRLRARLRTVDGADALVGGRPAVERDLDQANLRDAAVVIPLVLVAILAVLCLLLRALVAPVLLVLSQVLSFAAAFGVSLLVFEGWFGWHGQDAATLPVLAFVFLVALGVDYGIFLLTRVREEAPRIGTRPGTVRGLAATGGVITSAAVVLAATFSVLAILPTLDVAQLGFVVVVGILVDAFLVRSVLLPALALDLGHRVWWPHRLARPHPAAARPEPEPAGVTATTPTEV